MGRKKKQIEQPKEKQIPSSGIIYSGTVSIKQIRNNKIIKSTTAHNKGTKFLFSFLAECLTETFNHNKAPKYVRLFRVGDSETNPKPDRDHLLTLQASPRISMSAYNGEDASTVGITFLIPRNFIDNKDNDSKIGMIALYSTENKGIEQVGNYSACIILKDAERLELNSISSDTNLQITWELTISNSAA